MSRELKRVPLDFNHPLRVRWPGYVNLWLESTVTCKECDFTGYNPETSAYLDIGLSMASSLLGCRGLSKVKDPGLRTELLGMLGQVNHNRFLATVTQEEVSHLVVEGYLQRLVGIQKWEKFSWGSENPPSLAQVMQNLRGPGELHRLCRYLILERCKARGLYGVCPHCKGSGKTWVGMTQEDGSYLTGEEVENLSNRWIACDPPEGEGYQVWETCSEGSPITPVFANLEELCLHCEAEKVSLFGHITGTKDEWHRLLTDEQVGVVVEGMLFL